MVGRKFQNSVGENMKFPPSEVGEGINYDQIYVIVAKEQPEFSNFKNRLYFFWKLNHLKKSGLIFLEQDTTLRIGCSVPNIRLQNKVSRIIKLICFKKKYNFTVISGCLDLNAILQRVDVK